METALPRCPCGSGDPYQTCCEPFLQGQDHPATAEALMRSRYTAFSQGHIDYLIATHHPTRRSPDLRQTLLQNLAATVWLGLRVLGCEHGQAEDREGTVEFIAYYRQGQVGQLHERSRFVRQKGRWLYVEGDLLQPIIPKRNDPCWCGSGRRYKACHGS